MYKLKMREEENQGWNTGTSREQTYENYKRNLRYYLCI